jgi:hypothetical protein
VGTIILTRIPGLVGLLVRIGQSIAGDWSPWTHAALVVSPGLVAQAMPGGLEIVPWEHMLGGGDILELTGWPKAADSQIALLYATAKDLLGTPYGWLDYLSLTLAWLHIRPAWLRDHISSGRTMICSQAVDEMWARVGVHLYDDGRPSGDVTPGDLHTSWDRAMSLRPRH